MNVSYLNNKLDDYHMVRYSDHVSSNSLKRLDSARAARFAGFFFAPFVPMQAERRILLQIVAVLTICAYADTLEWR